MSGVFLESLLPALGFVVLLRTDRGDFRLLSTAPQWFADAAKTAAGDDFATLGGTLPFLEHIAAEGDKFWWSGEVGAVTGATFAVPGSTGDYLIRPRIATVDGHKLLLLEQLTGDADSRWILQSARESQLAHEQTRLRLGDIRGPIDTIAELASRLVAAELPAGARESAAEVLRAADKARAALNAIQA